MLNNENNYRDFLHIVFCVEHYNPLGLIRSLGEDGINPIVIVVKGGNMLVSSSKYISKLYEVESIEEGYSILLSKYAAIEKKAFLYTADDKITSYLDAHYDELVKSFFFFNAGENGRVAEFMNKDNINKLAIKHGLKVLDSVVTKCGTVPKNLEYPIITKSIASTEGGWKDDVFICYSESELKDAFTKIQSSDVLIQKYLEKKNELCIDGFSSNKGKEVFFSIASNYNYILPNTYSSYMTVCNFEDIELQLKLEHMIEEIGFDGIFSIEFLVDSNEELYFCEINFRNSTWSYASTCVKMPLPIMWAKSHLGKMDFEKCKKKIKTGFTAMVEPDDYKIRVKGGMISFTSWIKELKKCDCKFYINKKDMRPVLSIFINKVSKVLKKRSN